MRITFLSSALGAKLGGPAFSEVALINELSKHHQIDVFCPSDRYAVERPSDLPLVPVTQFRRVDVIRTWQFAEGPLAKAILKSDIFHLNGHWRWENYFLARFCQRAGIPYVFHPRGMLVVAHKRRHLKRAFNQLVGFNIAKQASAVIALSQFEADSFGPYHLAKENVFVVPNGVDVSMEIPATSKSMTFNNDGKYFLYLGRLNPRKNLEYLLRAYQFYREKGGETLLRFVGPAEPVYLAKMAKWIQELKLEKFVSISDGVYGSEKDKVLSQASAVIYPANDEAFGRVPFEAVAAGSVPLVPIESGSAEYLRQFFGWGFFSLQSIPSLGEALLQADTGRGKAAIEGARDWVRNELAWSHIADEIQNVYSRVLALRGLGQGKTVSLTESSILSNGIL